MQQINPLLLIGVIVVISIICTILMAEAQVDRKEAVSSTSDNLRKEDILENSEKLHSLSLSEALSKMRERKSAVIALRESERDLEVAGTTMFQQETTKSEAGEIKALRGGEFVGNRFRFKVKVLNESEYTVTEVRIFLISYPREALHIDVEDDVILYPKIDPDGYRSPRFDFLPTLDCVRGRIVAGVSFIDYRGKPHTLTTEPYLIRAVCDLLQPESIDPKELEVRLESLEHGEVVLKVDQWSPEEMYDKILRVLDESNFHEVSSEIRSDGGITEGRVTGWAKGKYTGKKIAVEVTISGVSRELGASCQIRVSGEDDAMILPAIDDLKDRLTAWLCPMCGSRLTIQNVEDLRGGKSVMCPFCSVVVAR